MNNKEKLEKASELISKSRAILEEKSTSAKDAEVAKLYLDEATNLRQEAEKSLDEPINKVPFNTKGDSNMSEEKSNSEKSAFYGYLKQGMRGLSEKALSSIRLADGGAIVPEDFRSDLLEAMDDILKFKGLATVIQTDRASFSLPVFEHTGTVNDTPEAGTITAASISDAFGRKTFIPHKKTVLFKVPAELLEDSDPNIERILIDHFSQRLAEDLEDDFINGNGVEKSEGILQNAGITAEDLGSSASTITGLSGINAILQAPYDIKEQYRSNAVYLMPRQSVKEVRLLKDSQNQPLFMPMSAGLPPQVNGYRLIELERMPTPAADGDCAFLFGNLKHYTIVQRKDVSIKRLDELYAANDQVGFLMTVRVDGAVTDAAAFKRFNRN